MTPSTQEDDLRHNRLPSLHSHNDGDTHRPDDTFGAGPQLFDTVIDGQRRRLAGAGQTSGVFYIWDRYIWDRVMGGHVWTVPPASPVHVARWGQTGNADLTLQTNGACLGR